MRPVRWHRVGPKLEFPVTLVLAAICVHLGLSLDWIAVGSILGAIYPVIRELRARAAVAPPGDDRAGTSDDHSEAGHRRRGSPRGADTTHHESDRG